METVGAELAKLVSITLTLLEPVLATNTRFRLAITPSEDGSEPTVIVTVWLVAPSMTVIALPPLFAT